MRGLKLDQQVGQREGTASSSRGGGTRYRDRYGRNDGSFNNGVTHDPYGRNEACLIAWVPLARI